MEKIRAARSGSVSRYDGVDYGGGRSRKDAFLIVAAFFIIVCFAHPLALSGEGLSLAEAVEQGWKANSSLRVQENELKKAELDGTIADSFSYPELSLFSSYSHIDPRPGVRKEILPGMAPLELNMGRNDMFSHGAQLRYILYEGGRRSHLQEASKQMKEASRWLLLDRRRTVQFDVRRAYLTILLLKEMEHLATDNLDRHRRRSADADRAFKAGTIARLELLRAQAEEEDARIAVDEAADRKRTGLRQFAILLNVKDLPDPIGDLQRASEQAMHFDVALLRAEEPEFARLMAVSFQRRASEEAAEAKKAESLPTVVTGVKAAQVNPYLGDKRYGPEYSAFLQLSYPIFDSGRSEAVYERAKIEAQNAALQADELERTLKAQYDLLIERIESGRRTILSRKVGVERAKLALEAAQVAQKNGSIDLSRLLDAEVLLLKSEVEFLRSTAEFYENLADWERWSGRSSGQFEIFNRSKP
jgi:outer membrane protein TolC